MADPLSPADRASLTAERGPINMAVGGVLVLERGRGVTYEAIVERVTSRLHLLPRYRQRVEQPALGIANPVWVDDEHFDPEWHVRRHVLPPPGGDLQLGEFVAREFSRRLDRSRPLWELHVVEGLPRGRVAVIPKMHHALVDGMAAIGVGMVLLDPTPEPMELEPAGDWSPRPYAIRTHLAKLATGQLSRAQRFMVEGALRALDTSPRRAADEVRRASELVAQLARSRPQAPMTFLNREISINRDYALVRARLDQLKRAGAAGGGTVNDAILAAVAGMLRRLLDEAGDAHDGRDPVALVPVNVRRGGDTEMGNRISMVFVDLPVAEAGPLDRIGRINAQTRGIRDSAAVRAGTLMVGFTGFAPPFISSMFVRAIGSVRACNLVVSNVPGPQQPFYLNGSKVLEVFPIVPLNPVNQGLSVGVLSYDGGVHFGVFGDRRLEPGVDRAALALEASLAELLDASRPAR